VKFVFLPLFLLGLVLGVISMLVGVDRRKKPRPVPPLVTLPAIGAFATVAGMVGYLLVRYSELGTVAIAVIALIAGLASAGGLLALVAGVVVPSASREVVDERYTLQGYLARVVRGIGSADNGEITYQHEGAWHRVPARSLEGRAIGEGAEVAIDRVEDGIAYVHLWSTIERQLELPS
jgi:hypothetical protein